MKILATSILFLFLYLLFFTPLPEDLVLRGPPEQDWNDIEARMEFHGTLFAWIDKEGKWSFLNNEGKVCRLWKP